MTTPLGHTTRYQSDALGRTTVVTDATGASVFFAYDALSRITAITDGMGRTTSYTYDANGNLTGVVKPIIGAAGFSYNSSGLLTRFTDPRGKDWSFAYTPMGRLASQTDPLGNQQAYQHDDFGLVNRIVHADSSTTAIAYNTVGLPITVAHSSGPTRTYAYDAGGRLLTTEGLTLTYDIRGDVIASGDGTGVFAASYDNGQRLKTVTYAGQVTVTYTYDARSQLTRVADSKSGAWIAFGYDADGNLAIITRSNTVNTALTYNAVGDLTRIRDGEIADQQYTLNADGETIRQTRILPYDPLPDVPAPAEDLTYDDAGQISSPGYAYDQRGRQIAAPNRTFSYDGASRLIAVSEGGVSASFTYNGLGDITARASQGVATTYEHGYALPGAPIVAEGQDASYKRFYVYAPSGELLYSVDAASGAVRFYRLTASVPRFS